MKKEIINKFTIVQTLSIKETSILFHTVRCPTVSGVSRPIQTIRIAQAYSVLSDCTVHNLITPIFKGYCTELH